MEEEIRAEKSGNRMVSVDFSRCTGCGSMALQKIWLVSDL